MKTGGFNLENTHVCDPKRLLTLICIVAIAFCFSLKAGRLVADKSKSKLKNNGYMEKSIVKLGLDALFKSIFFRDKKLAEEHYEQQLFNLKEIFVL